MSTVNDISNALSALQEAFNKNGLKPPVKMTIDPDVFATLIVEFSKEYSSMAVYYAGEWTVGFTLLGTEFVPSKPLRMKMELEKWAK